MKTLLMVMDSSGDQRIEFDEADVEAKAKAEELFNRLTGKGARAFRVNQPGGDKPVSKFADVQGEVVIVPVIVGG